MCELFGLSARNPIKVNTVLNEFFTHSEKNPDGWGLAVFRGNSVSLEKEPKKALDSVYLHNRLAWDITASDLLAHVRRATIGFMNYSNCHPFVWDDKTGRSWTLIHNGTIFETDLISPFSEALEGSTDSEAALLYLISLINRATDKKGEPLSASERFDVIDKALVKLAACGKLNILLFDGEQLYVHTNYKDSLYVRKTEDFCSFSTTPLSEGTWEKLPMNRPFGYIAGECVHEGTSHDHEFLDSEHDMTLIYSAFAAL